MKIFHGELQLLSILSSKNSFFFTLRSPSRQEHTGTHTNYTTHTDTSTANTSAMHIELGVAVNFVVSHLYNRLPRRRVNLFADELENGLREKFKGHWHVDDACKGSAYRCIRVSGDNMDHAVSLAIQLSGLDVGEVMQIIPAELTLWIDPKEVTYRTGESSYMKLLYSARNQPLDNDAMLGGVNAPMGANCSPSSLDDIDRELGLPRDTFVSLAMAGHGGLPSGGGCGGGGGGGQNTFQPIDIAGGASSTGNSLRVSPISPASTSSAAGGGGGSSPATFTAAMFAQTKFGSTKLKSNKKQCPTDISVSHQRVEDTQDDSPWRKMLLAN